MATSDEVERMYKEPVVAYFKCYPSSRMEELEKTTKTSARINGRREYVEVCGQPHASAVLSKGRSPPPPVTII
jgi:hypothetical protein